MHRSEPSPEYKPRYVAPVQEWRPPSSPARTAGQQLDPATLLMVVGGAAFLILLIAAAVTSERAAVDKMHKKTDEAHADAAQAKTLATQAASTADDIDAYIAARLDDAYRAGRNSLPGSGDD